MKIGIGGLNSGPFGRPEVIAQFAREAEALGFESLAAFEHICVPVKHRPYPGTPDGQVPGGDRSPIAEPLSTLVFAAAVTSRIRLMTGAILLPLHHPLYLAKQLATLDVLSNGRAILGIANGWCAEEYQALGIDWKTRGKRTDESIGAMRALWRNEAASFRGAQFDFQEVYSFPKPAQKDGIPVLVGGHSPATARRAARIGDGFYPLAPDSEELKKLIALMREEARKAGRNPDTIEISTSAANELDAVKRLRDLGVSRVMLRPPEPAQIRAGLEKIANDIIAKL
ncbi:MAG TPA: LLM class F420-dependent oxidoreductase [Candidatus Binataceae bacterium]|nr:LLM class F420-dependent oxidoreductase [Candidatus Binataceae bacterium]